MEARPGERVVFGDYAFDLRSAVLFKRGRLIRVPDQSLKVLAALLESPGNVITREELSSRLWPNGTHVEFEQGLNSVIKRLRAVLLDSSTAPRYIETLPKRGYRFVCPIHQESPASVQPEAPPANPLRLKPGFCLSRGSGMVKFDAARGIAVLVAVLLVSASVAFLYQRSVSSRSRALDGVALRARSFVEKGDYGSAYDLAVSVALRLPADDPGLKQLWAIVSRRITVISSPSDAAVFWQPYADATPAWRFLGKTPLREGRVPVPAVRLRLTKPGYEAVEIAAPDSNYDLRLESSGPDAGMIHIAAGPVFARYAGIGELGPVTVNDFWIDATEVTNSEFQRFVDAGGYEDPRYWTFQIIENGRLLSWDQTMAKFTDQTGIRSPSGWSAGRYREGEGDYPVSGVSWYEAAAYAAFGGKALPSVYQWFRAAHTDDSAFLLPLSNFSGLGPVPVRSRRALGSFGVYDMAGNVREWCVNESGRMRFALGGAWSDPDYMFTRGQRLPALNRSVTNGFRCVRAGQPANAQPQLAASIPAAAVDSIPVVPASDEVFNAARSLYAYDHTDLHSTVESISDSEAWRREKVHFRAGYANQQILAYLFLPKQKRPPYKCVVFVPSGDAFEARPGDSIQPLEPVLRSGMAIVYPIFWGTFDRFVALPSDRANAGYPTPMFIREALVAWRKDLGRTLDYLQTRTDIGPIGYLAISTGAEFAPVLLAGEERIKTAVLLSGAMPVQMKLMPESNPINFARHLTMPVLMLNGRYDSILTTGAQESMFRSLGTAALKKSHIYVDSGHGILAPEVREKTIYEMLVWFNRYLGPI